MQMQASEQVHSISIYQQLLDDGETDQDLLVAALLHDVGKSCYPLHLWDRVVIVLAKAFIPDKVKEIGQSDHLGWRRPFVVAEQHAAWGAELAAQAGASETAVAIIRRHQEQSPRNRRGDLSFEDHLVLRLQRFDEEN